MWIALWIVNTYPESELTIFCNNRHIKNFQQFLHDSDAKAIAIPQAFSKNRWAKNMTAKSEIDFWMLCGNIRKSRLQAFSVFFLPTNIFQNTFSTGQKKLGTSWWRINTWSLLGIKDHFQNYFLQKDIAFIFPFLVHVYLLPTLCISFFWSHWQLFNTCITLLKLCSEDTDTMKTVTRTTINP